VQLDVLGRLAEGGQVAATDATARRHAQSCPICRSVWEGQARAHQSLAGLTVVALPEQQREAVLTRVDAQSRAYLPLAAELLVADDEAYADEPGRWHGPLYAVLALIGAVVVGTLIGLVLSRSPGPGRTASVTPTDPAVSPTVTTAPQPTLTPSPTLAPTPAGGPTPSVFLITPTPSPGRVGSGASPTGGPEPATEPLTLSANPASGPNGAAVTVEGTGWTRRGTVTLDYLDPLGRQTGSHATAAVDARGRFTTTLAAQDPANLPGRHIIRATDGAQSDSATYDVS
jgi:hypothetical protein